MDGTFTENTALTWITPYLRHLITDKCTLFGNNVTYDMPVVSCNKDVFLRKVSFYEALPSDLQNYPLKIANLKENLTDSTVFTT